MATKQQDSSRGTFLRKLVSFGHWFLAKSYLHMDMNEYKMRDDPLFHGTNERAQELIFIDVQVFQGLQTKCEVHF